MANRSWIGGLGAAFVVVLGSTPLPAQESSAQPTLAEVIVTAQKREQSLQDVPISVAVMGKSSSLSSASAH